jgi:hypothetical protein
MELMSLESSENGNERRHGVAAVPLGIEARFTELQRLALSRFSNFGWSLAFVRHSHGAGVTVVLRGPDNAGHAVLTEDGDLDRDTALSVRR